jgi:hypothetical protein
VKVNCDNQAALKLIYSGVMKAKTKHIAAKYHHVCDEQKQQKSIEFHYNSTQNNIEDLLTKALQGARHQSLTEMIGIGSSWWDIQEREIVGSNGMESGGNDENVIYAERGGNFEYS